MYSPEKTAIKGQRPDIKIEDVTHSPSIPENLKQWVKPQNEEMEIPPDLIKHNVRTISHTSHVLTNRTTTLPFSAQQAGDELKKASLFKKAADSAIGLALWCIRQISMSHKEK